MSSWKVKHVAIEMIYSTSGQVATEPQIWRSLSEQRKGRRANMSTFWTLFLVSHNNLDAGVIAVGSQELVFVGDLVSHVGDGLLSDLGESLSTLEVGSRLSTALVLELVDDASVFPSDFGGEAAQNSVRSVRVEAKSAESSGDDHALNLVEGGRDTLEDLETLESFLTLDSSVGEHATDDAVEDATRGAVVDGTTSRVGAHGLVQVGLELQLVAREGARDVDTLAADSHNLLAAKQFLGNSGSQTTQQVSAAVNHHTFLEHLVY